ncbi:hypothetical protein [Massilia sp. S19_KUP03_FR1]
MSAPIARPAGEQVPGFQMRGQLPGMEAIGAGMHRHFCSLMSSEMQREQA